MAVTPRNALVLLVDEGFCLRVGAPEEREGERGGVCEVAAAAIAAAISSGSLPSTGPGESSNRSADASARRAAART